MIPYTSLRDFVLRSISLIYLSLLIKICDLTFLTHGFLLLRYLSKERFPWDRKNTFAIEVFASFLLKMFALTIRLLHARVAKWLVFWIIEFSYWHFNVSCITPQDGQTHFKSLAAFADLIYLIQYEVSEIPYLEHLLLICKLKPRSVSNIYFQISLV